MIKKNQKMILLHEDNAWYDDSLCENFSFEQKALQSEIDRLDATSKEVIHLTYYEDLSYHEIWTILNIPKNTVGTILFNAKRKLKYLPLFQSE